MTVPYSTIHEILLGRMVAFTGIDSGLVDHANADYSGGTFAPPKSGVWCAFNIQYGAASFCGMADVPAYRRPGQVVIQCFCRRGEGLGRITTLADSLADHFQSWSSGHVECGAATITVAGEFAEFYQINVSIRFRAG